MTRNEKLLAHIDVDLHTGLEIGALCSPVVPASCVGISYVDHLNTEGLRKKYATDPHVDVEKIVPVRYVWNGGPLVDIVGAEQFDYVIASHVLEHAPDLIGWLQYISQILKPGGVLALAVPDMRYTFDCRRNLTTMADLLQAYFEQYRRPSIRQVLDHFIHKVEVPEQCLISDLWDDPLRSAKIPRSHPLLLQELGEQGLRKHFDSIQAGEYIDTHCSVLTPESFVKLMSQMAVLDMAYFTVKSFHPTLPNEHEFLMVLEKLPDEVTLSYSRENRQNYVVDRLPRSA
jgi:SAM-dependent methyltransferase